MDNKTETTGIFVNLYRSPLRMVFRRHINFRWDRYDIFKPCNKIDAVVVAIGELSKEDPGFINKLIAVDEKHYRNSSYRKRHYVHQDRNFLYSADRKDLAEIFSESCGCMAWNKPGHAANVAGN
jgi:hypothetical protein